MLELLLLEPAAVPRTPGLLPREPSSVLEHEGADLLLVHPEDLDRGRPSADQVADRFVALVRHPDRGQLASAEQPGQRDRVAPVGLDPIARLPRDQRRRDDRALVPQAGDEPV
jgi:hypothetical protein